MGIENAIPYLMVEHEGISKPPLSPARLAANRRNAQKSTGPRPRRASAAPHGTRAASAPLPRNRAAIAGARRRPARPHLDLAALFHSHDAVTRKSKNQKAKGETPGPGSAVAGALNANFFRTEAIDLLKTKDGDRDRTHFHPVGGRQLAIGSQKSHGPAGWRGCRLQTANCQLISGTEATDLLKTKDDAKDRTHASHDVHERKRLTCRKPMVGLKNMGVSKSCRFDGRYRDHGVHMPTRSPAPARGRRPQGQGTGQFVAFGGRPRGQNRPKPTRVKAFIMIEITRRMPTQTHGEYPFMFQWLGSSRSADFAKI